MPSGPSAAAIRNIALERGASACGVIRAEALAEYARFQAAAAGAPPGLAYLRLVPSPRPDIRRWFASAKSVLVCAFRYWSPERDHAAAMEKAGDLLAYLKNAGRKLRPEFIAGVKARGLRPKISRYVLVPDYHRTIMEKLALALADIKAAWPGTEGKAFVDSAPVLEKELGRLAGLGFRGRNTLLVSEELGSYFFLGGLALSCGMPEGEPSSLSPALSPGAKEPGCGTCRKCADACPTGALKSPGVLDAGLCISYWTQSKTAAPEEIISRSEGYIYGCDICQEACPYNNP
jgi:epoxyqueuosine reductase QueG